MQKQGRGFYHENNGIRQGICKDFGRSNTITPAPQSGPSRARIGGRNETPDSVPQTLRTLLPALLLTVLVSACETTPVAEPEPAAEPVPEVPAIPENPDIVEARKTLAAARERNAEWLVLEPRVSDLPVSLSEILRRAEQAEEDGDTALASDLARLVSRLSRLGLRQVAEQFRAGPYYPQ